ncbi:ATP-binding protein [Ohtaekwangia koreensis]|uniref:histidine kinase n=1 Tax=Ohtaekwangia koreensis TaxID=688867 RepID=A0A1T5JI78_9BACT|nr:ATP-binding protein [Ohtaekwangia koreensis]SKC51139.1 Signal transduction histidine kinase [Ohtaekwangia koreensis]
MHWYRFVHIFLLSCLIFACKDSNYTLPLSQKQEIFTYLNDSLQSCYSKSPDSILVCSDIESRKAFLHSLRPSAKAQEIWINFAKAHSLSESNFGEESIEIINSTLPETEDYTFLYERAQLLSLRSFINTNHFNLQLAAYDAYQAADIFLELGLTKEAASKHLSIANLQYNTGNYEIAIEHIKKVVKYYKTNNLKRDDSIRLINAYNTLGMSYVNQNDTDSARMTYNTALVLVRMSHSEIWEALIQGNIAQIDYLEGYLDEALIKYKQKAEVCLKHREFASAGEALTGLAEVYSQKKQFTTAQLYYDSAWKMMRKELRPNIWVMYYKSLHDWFNLNKQYDSAHIAYKKYITLRDSTQSRQSLQLNKLQKQLQFEKQLNLLRTENELKKNELNTSRILIASFIAILILLCVLLYIIRKSYRKIRMLNADLESKVRTRTADLVKLNKELDTYLYRASHDVRRPILSIIGLGQLVGLAHDESERKAIQQKIDDTARDMDKMLSKIHMAYELDKLEGDQLINIKEYTISLTHRFKVLYPNITFKEELEDNIVINTNIKLLDIIFINILENACIFRNQVNPEITIKLFKTDSYIEIYFRDNGIGIDQKYIKAIFNPYARYSDRSVGSGLGLHLVQKALIKLKGYISVESTLYIGSEFKITLPIYKDGLSELHSALNNSIKMN